MGETVYVDYAGPKFNVVVRGTDEVRRVVIFAGIPAAIQLHLRGSDLEAHPCGLYALAHMDDRVLRRCAGALVVPDNEKATVNKASCYGPTRLFQATVLDQLYT